MNRLELRDKLITLNPKKRIKGFKDSNIRINNNENDDFKYSKTKISNICNNIHKLNLSQNDINILEKVNKSYQKVSDKIELDKEDFILKKHENVEFKRVSDEKKHKYIIYRYKFNIYPKIKKVDTYPLCVQIEPTSICNFRCIMCYQADKSFSSKSNGFMGNMSFETFKIAIDELENNIEAITFASRGEPTLNQDFKKMLKYTEGKFLGLKINTNASMLNEELIHSILSSSLQTIVFSIDAKDKEQYEKIRINGKFEKIIKNLELFNKIRNKHYKREDKIVRISGVKINNDQNVDEMREQWGDIADLVAFTNYVPWESSYENEINDIVSPCGELWSRLFVWQDGKVNPCDYDYKSLLSKWNIKDKSISEIWNSEEYNYLRYCHLNSLRNKIEPCKRCINC